MSKIVIEVKDCRDCPYCNKKYIYTSNLSDKKYNYFCTKTNDKHGRPVGHAVEHRGEMPPIPDWCPISADRYIRRFAEKIGSRIAGHSNYHGDSILSAIYCLAEGKEVNHIEPLE